MKSLMIVCVLAAALGGAAVGCGPQHPYCAQYMGQCVQIVDSGPPDMPDVGMGEAIIIGNP